MRIARLLVLPLVLCPVACRGPEPRTDPASTDVDGTAVCRVIRADPELVETKIIMISGVADPEEIEELARVGADEFIKKPFDVDTVIDRISELVGM